MSPRLREGLWGVWCMLHGIAELDGVAVLSWAAEPELGPMRSRASS